MFSRVVSAKPILLAKYKYNYFNGEIGPEAKEAVADLIAALKDPDPLLRNYAAKALGGKGIG